MTIKGPSGIAARVRDVLRRSGSSGEPYADFRRRLEKVAGKDGSEILRALVEETSQISTGVNGAKFRIRFKHRLEKIHQLTGRFIDEEFENGRIYRPKLLALAIAGTQRANDLLALIDRVIILLAAEYENEPSRNVTAAALSERFDVRIDALYEALWVVKDLGISGGCGPRLPDTPDWYIVPGEPLLQLPDLSAVLEQQTKWAEDGAKAADQGAIFYDGHPDWKSRWKDRLTGWIGRSKYASLIYVAGGLLLGVLLYAIGLMEAVSRAAALLFGGE